MAIQAECPACHRRNSLNNKKCSSCRGDMVAAKRRKIRYFLEYRLPDGKRKFEFAGNTLTEAKAADGKRKAQAA
ncbi:MAG: hypothetical protein MI749_18070, partial [Desulfovibrionales bacterium]|nr:hypothetical protein [Desulfovibrionales bacterium]